MKSGKACCSGCVFSFVGLLLLGMCSARVYSQDSHEELVQASLAPVRLVEDIKTTVSAELVTSETVSQAQPDLHNNVVVAAQSQDWKALYSALVAAKDAGLTDTLRMAEAAGYFLWIEKQRAAEQRQLLTHQVTSVSFQQRASKDQTVEEQRAKLYAISEEYTEKAAVQNQLDAADAARKRTVYVTDEGKKYHSASCRFTKNATAISLENALASGKEPCSVCGGG